MARAPERIVFLLDMDAFFASCEQARDPTLGGKPVIVCGNPKTRSVVAACSYEAKAFGVRNGMSTAQARTLCPQAVPVPGHPALYVEIARRIFGRLSAYTPQVEVVSIDEAFLDVTDTWARFAGSVEGLARRIQGEVARLERLPCTLGIGPNKRLAKLAAEQAKPRGVGRIRPEAVPGCLAPLPVEAMSGIGPRTAERLAGLGITTLGQLARVPEVELVRRFGLLGRVLRAMALGQDDSPVEVEGTQEEIKSMGHAYTLERDTRDPRVLFGTLLKLCEKVGRRLRREGLAGRTICAQVRFSDFSSASRRRTGPDFLNDGLAIYRAARRLLEEITGRKPRPVRLVGVSVSHLARSAPSADLWEDRLRRQDLTAALDRIRDLFGEEAVTRAGTLVPFVEKTKGYFGPRWD